MAIRLTDVKSTGASYAELDDKMLVLDFQAGQPQAFVEIHRRYAPLARHVCRRFLPNPQDTDEAFQETMIRVFQGLFRFNGQFALQPWIARIATNVSLDQLRSRARRPQLDDDSLETHDREDDGDTPDQLVERLLERDLVLAVLADLPESHRRALVLRELEGRSHKEIAETMGMTPAQAKALIHRAKGSFRRSWLLRATERGGVMGIALMPLAYVVKAMNAARRLGDKVVHVGGVAQIATPELVSTSASVGAPATAGLAERAVAAGVTLLLAGGVTVGAVTVTRDRGPEVGRERIVAAAPARAEKAPAPQVAEPAPDVPVVEAAPEKPDRGHHSTPNVEVPPSTVPSPDPDPSEPPAEPTDDPSPDVPSPTGPVEPIPPAPALTFVFGTGATSEERCGCGGTSVVSETVEGTLPDVSFSQAIEGAALEASGEAAWTLSMDLSGTVSASGGELRFSFVLGAEGELSSYEGTASVTGSEVDTNGAYLFTFGGSYRPLGDVVEGRPAGGAMSAQVGIWPDGSIYLAAFDLS